MPKSTGGSGAPKGEGNYEAAMKIYNKRKGAINYGKVIFWTLAAQFGAKSKGKFKKKTAIARRATPTSPTAYIDTGGVEQDFKEGLLKDAFVKGIKRETKETLKYANDKLAKTAARFSGR
jgi:hypothetical protein